MMYKIKIHWWHCLPLEYLIVQMNPLTSTKNYLANPDFFEHEINLIMYSLAPAIGSMKFDLFYRSMRIRQVLKSVRAFHMSDNSNAYQMEFANSVMRKHTGDQITFSYLANKTSYYPSTGSYQHKIVREGRPHDFIEVIRT